MRKFNVAVVGATGAVGEELFRVLEEYDFPINKLIPLASSRSAGSKVEYKKDKISPEFRFFMNENLDIVINEGTIESYNNFVILFEVIIGLLYGKGQIDNK